MYSLKECNESFNTLKYEFTLSDFLTLEEFFDITNSVQEEAHLEQRKAMESAKRNKR